MPDRLEVPIFVERFKVYLGTEKRHHGHDNNQTVTEQNCEKSKEQGNEEYELFSTPRSSTPRSQCSKWFEFVRVLDPVWFLGGSVRSKVVGAYPGAGKQNMVSSVQT